MKKMSDPRFHRAGSEIMFGDDYAIDYIIDRLNDLQYVKSQHGTMSPAHRIERALLLQAVIDWGEE
jgi:hypothetical protein